VAADHVIPAFELAIGFELFTILLGSDLLQLLRRDGDFAYGGVRNPR